MQTLYCNLPKKFTISQLKSVVKILSILSQSFSELLSTSISQLQHSLFLSPASWLERVQRCVATISSSELYEVLGDVQTAMCVHPMDVDTVVSQYYLVRDRKTIYDYNIAPTNRTVDLQWRLSLFNGLYKKVLFLVSESLERLFFTLHQYLRRFWWGIEFLVGLEIQYLDSAFIQTHISIRSRDPSRGVPLTELQIENYLKLISKNMYLKMGYKYRLVLSWAKKMAFRTLRKKT